MILPNGMKITTVSIADGFFEYEAYIDSLLILSYDNSCAGIGDSDGCWVAFEYWDNVFSTE